jgi:hypothetical protein
MRQARVRQLLSAAGSSPSLGDRIDVLSGLLLGCPYVDQPLIGGAATPEVFTASLERFDCVTYVETVVALSRVSRAGQFADRLRQIRYRDGAVVWEHRNHYMTTWIQSNTRNGSIRRIPIPAGARRLTRLLDVVPGLPRQRASFACVPKSLVKSLEAQVKTGDLVFFVSTRAHLDVFHTGILVRAGDSLRMRHAARSRGVVVEQDFHDFLKRNRMTGVIVVRPRPVIEKKEEQGD